MIIKKVTITNFFCYLDSNVFEFSKGLNIISAPNGAGKSQLFNSFYWTFFDKIYIDKAGQTEKKEWRAATNVSVCPEKLIAESNLGDEIQSSVEIQLNAQFDSSRDSEELIDYTFTKTAIYKKSGREVVIKQKPELTISYVRDGETEYIPSHLHNDFLERIFPASIRKFMWYQGETMENLYDFSSNVTLRNAINEISYYPIYDVMEKIVVASKKSIDEKIEKELNKLNKLNSREQTLFREINILVGKIETKEDQILVIRGELEKLEDDISSTEEKLKGYDEFVKVKTEMVRLESELAIVKNNLENADGRIKEKLIHKWILNGCEDLIDASKTNLELLNTELQQAQKVSNPVPTSLPGPEYVEKMLEDKKCYICEREVEDNSLAYEALKRRLNDFEINLSNRILQDNYTELNKARARLNKELPGIRREIKEEDDERESLIKERKRLQKKLNSIFDEVGYDQRQNIISGASTASNLVSKLQTFRRESNSKAKNLQYLLDEVQVLKADLVIKNREKETAVKNTDTNIVESQAADYIKMFVKSIGKLRMNAYEKLIDEIQKESNRLYALYLGGKQQGKIVIDNGIKIVDEVTKEVMTNLNTGELVAQKLAVAYSFLSLSAKKMNRSYPIIADAPTSDLDPTNTYHLTQNIGHSFEQIIIISKDYIAFSDIERGKLIKDAGIAKFYMLENKRIDPVGPNSRINKKSFITSVK